MSGSGGSPQPIFLSQTTVVSGLVSGVMTGVRLGVATGLVVGVEAVEGPSGVRSLSMEMSEMLRSIVLSSTLSFSIP